MPNKTHLTLLPLLLATLAFSGCGYFQFPGVHRVTVQQGNIITQEMVDKLRIGMTKSQVRYIMGSAIVADTFNQDRWDYFFSSKKGSRLYKQENVTVFFINGNVSRVDSKLEPEEESSEEE